MKLKVVRGHYFALEVHASSYAFDPKTMPDVTDDNPPPKLLVIRLNRIKPPSAVSNHLAPRPIDANSPFHAKPSSRPAAATQASP